MTAWWEGDVIDRPAIMIEAPRVNPDDYLRWGALDFLKHPDDPRYAVRNFETWCSSTFFAGEAFPNLFVYLGTGVLAAFLGADPVFYSDTLWFDGSIEWDQLGNIEMDPQNEWWRRARRDTEISVEKGAGKFFVGITDLGGMLDVAQSLRGKKRLMVDLFRLPEKVTDLCWSILEIWSRCYNELDKIIQSKMKGSSAWMGIWCKDRWHPLACDYAYMLSPTKFREFVLPFIEEQCRRLDHSIYHLDGYGQIPHLDALLNIPELDAIQWVPGIGKPQRGSEKHFPMYKRIRSAGKGLYLSVSPNEIEPICRHIGAEGILFHTRCQTEQEAKKLLVESFSWV